MKTTDDQKVLTKNTYHWTTRSMVLVPIFAALMAVLSQITVPMVPVPITLQTLIIGLIASITPIYISTAATGLYLTLGAFGLPVFAGGKGGMAVLFGPNGGYLLSFLLMCYLIGFFVQINRKASFLIIANLLAMLVNMFIGMLWLMVSTNISLSQSFSVGFAPFIIPGLLKVVIIVISANILLNFNNCQLYK